MTWALLTGEYPPRPGGVADYTRQIARALAAAGDAVHVFAPEGDAALATDPGVLVHPARFGPRGLGRLSSELGALPATRRLLVQWVPHAFGWKAMNLPLALWLARQDGLSVTFHEVHFPKGQSAKGDVLATVTRFMSEKLARAAQRIFVTIPAWGDLVRTLGATSEPVWLPVPSNVPLDVDAAAVRVLREKLSGSAPLVGHFGTYGGPVTDLLGPALRALGGETRILLAGRNGQAFARTSGLAAERVVATGELGPAEVAPHLAACDVVFQPYVDGASTRRTSLMTPLGLGAAIVTNEGPLSEPLWRESGAVALAPATPEGYARRIESLLADEPERRRLGERARELYRTRFALEHVVRVLRESP